MKKIGEAQKVTAPNAWGRDSTAIHTTYEIEEQDVGRMKANYLGYNRPGLMIRRSDIGKQIIVMTDGTGWTCWSWK